MSQLWQLRLQSLTVWQPTASEAFTHTSLLTSELLPALGIWHQLEKGPGGKWGALNLMGPCPLRRASSKRKVSLRKMSQERAFSHFLNSALLCRYFFLGHLICVCHSAPPFMPMIPKPVCCVSNWLKETKLLQLGAQDTWLEVESFSDIFLTRSFTERGPQRNCNVEKCKSWKRAEVTQHWYTQNWDGSQIYPYHLCGPGRGSLISISLSLLIWNLRIIAGVTTPWQWPFHSLAPSTMTTKLLLSPKFSLLPFPIKLLGR